MEEEIPQICLLLKKIEKFFGIDDNRLINSARKERVNLKTGLNNLIQAKPELQELLLRADSLPPDQFDDLLSKVRVLTKDSEDEDSCLFLNYENRNFYDWRNHRNQ